MKHHTSSQCFAELPTGEGLYLYAADGTFFDLSRARIQQLADIYWNDPEKLPSHVKRNDVFQPCEICPYKGQEVLCFAIKPLLPFLEEMDRFHSYDDVTAVYTKAKGLHTLKRTTMQQALHYVTTMSIFEYCEGAKKYSVYYRGLEPFLDLNEASARLFLNIYWLNRDNVDKVEAIQARITQTVTTISRNCVKRLNLICKSDVFINAYVNTHFFSEYLSFSNPEQVLLTYFSKTGTGQPA